MSKGLRRVAVVTGTRAEFGLLRPVCAAIEAHPDLALEVLVSGTHLIAPHPTIGEVSAVFPIAAIVEMQRAGETGRRADAEALGRGVSGFAARLAEHPVDVLLVLGDRIEAFAAAAAAAIGGTRVAHVHGGDRAEGIADEAMRHAISKLAHLHLAATADSAQRLLGMGEEPGRVHVVGSPAIDGLDAVDPLADDVYDDLGRPEIVFLMHPAGRSRDIEHDRASRVLARCRRAGRVLALHPNHDPGREGILDAIDEADEVAVRPHLPRETFVGLLRRVRAIVGNSSAGLIEAAAVPVRCVDIGSRQTGRERGPNVITCPDDGDDHAVEIAVTDALERPATPFRHPYGDGRAGRRIADLLATFEPDKYALRKRNTF
ncbi:MAG: UDP-N-acetylglucosamine 2-epimerase (hydrolyzing) [Planctomycetes bacterium]|nr:UDP-N-acetylglucosamine 2-epimerase (hydrolyzing) [Planctomycetota bacterium]